MENSSNLSILNRLLKINILIFLLSACQSANVISNISVDDAESDAVPQLAKDATDPFNNITGKITNLYAKKTLEDYIGDFDKRNISIATQKAAATDKPQIFTNQESGVKGKAEVIKSRTLSIQEPGKKDGIRECKTVRQTIILKDKREVIESVMVCKSYDGWS